MTGAGPPRSGSGGAMPSITARSASTAGARCFPSRSALSSVVSRNACRPSPPEPPPHSASAACSAPRRGKPAAACFFSLLRIHPATSARHSETASARRLRRRALGSLAPAAGASAPRSGAPRVGLAVRLPTRVPEPERGRRPRRGALSPPTPLRVRLAARGRRSKRPPSPRAGTARRRSPRAPPRACARPPSCAGAELLRRRRRVVAAPGPGTAPPARRRGDGHRRAGAAGSRARATLLAYASGYASSSRDARSVPPARSVQRRVSVSSSKRTSPPSSRVETSVRPRSPSSNAFESNSPASLPHLSQGGAGAVVFRMASNAASATSATSRVGSARGGSGDKTPCAACQKASSRTRACQVEPVCAATALRCWWYQVRSASTRRDAPAGASAASAGRRSFSEPSANEGSLAAPAGPCSIRSTTREDVGRKKARREVCCLFTREAGTRAWGVRGERGSRESKRGARLDARASRERAVRGPRPSPESAPGGGRVVDGDGTIVALSSSEKPTPRVDRDARSVGPGHAPR